MDVKAVGGGGGRRGRAALKALGKERKGSASGTRKRSVAALQDAAVAVRVEDRHVFAAVPFNSSASSLDVARFEQHGARRAVGRRPPRGAHGQAQPRGRGHLLEIPDFNFTPGRKNPSFPSGVVMYRVTEAERTLALDLETIREARRLGKEPDETTLRRVGERNFAKARERDFSNSNFEWVLEGSDGARAKSPSSSSSSSSVAAAAGQPRTTYIGRREGGYDTHSYFAIEFDDEKAGDGSKLPDLSVHPVRHFFMFRKKLRLRQLTAEEAEDVTSRKRSARERQYMKLRCVRVVCRVSWRCVIDMIVLIYSRDVVL